jgi:hypothetical protein
MIQNGVYRLYAIHHGEHPGEIKHRLAARFMVDDGNLEILEDHYGHMDDVLPEGPLTEAHRRALAYLLDSGYWSCQHEDARDGGEHPETLAEFQLPPLPEGVPTFRVKGGEFDGQELKVAGDTVIVGGQKLPEAQAQALLRAAEAGEIELELVERQELGKSAPLAKSDNRDEYGGEHSPPDPSYGAPLHDLTRIYPEDVYSTNAVRYYGTGEDQLDARSFSIAHSMRGKPHGKVRIYRAIPNDLSAADINPGDWVTINRAYAVGHGKSALNGRYKILSKLVRADEIYTDGNSIHEFGYWPRTGGTNV